MHLHVVKNRKVWYAVSITLVVASVLALSVWRLHPGIDFTGGSLLEVSFTKAPDSAALRATLDTVGHSAAMVQSTSTEGFLIRTETLEEPAHQALLASLREEYGDMQELRFDSIGPAIGKELRRDAALAVGISLLLISIYIAWMFRSADSFVSSKKVAFVTVMKTVHDVLISVGSYAVLGYFFGYEADIAFVAAALTILGYSINDGVVVLDRTRENLKGGIAHNLEEVVDRSIDQTLARSINTSVTVFLALLAIFLLGGASTRPFALFLLIGVVVCTYSSVFIASPLLVERWPFGKKS